MLNRLILAAIAAFLTVPRAAAWDEIYKGEMWRSANPGGREGTWLVAYGGYRADGPGAMNWARALAEAAGIRGIVAVQGPRRMFYEDREKTAANATLTDLLRSADPLDITVAAHSSGSYVAHELLGLLAATPLLAKTRYYDLDGATCKACAALAAAAPGFSYTCVAARQGALRSPNYDSAAACGKGHFTVLDLPAGCTGAWCLHGRLVNERAAAIDPVSPKVALYYNDPLLVPAAGCLR